jgi:methyl-accepting chemotaxis protein
VIYIALDYDKLSGPITRHSIILIVSGLTSLLALFLLVIKLFNNIYENLRKIKMQIISLEEGDFTVTSKLDDGGELQLLSETTNRMTATLNQVLKDTRDQASNVQNLAALLEADANESVDKLYQLSVETTVKTRDEVEEIFDLLNKIEQQVRSKTIVDDDFANKIEKLKSIAKDHSVDATFLTLTLSDLLKSLHGQSSKLSDISNHLLNHMEKFILEESKTNPIG